MEIFTIAVIGVVVLAIVTIAKTATIVPQQQAYVIENLGKYSRTLRAGFHILIPFIERIAYKHSLKEVAIDIPEQLCITKDNVQVGVDGILYLQILDAQRALNALKWLIKEMERRFQILSAVRVRDIAGYHVLWQQEQQKKGKKKSEEEMEQMPYIVLIIDELADLMASRGKEVEALVVRLAQMARAVGIHLVLATQRPSVEVITGLIKANVTARIAFKVASQIDSRTILDQAGAEKLLGRGDMLFISAEFSRPKRIQGAYVSDKDVKHVVEWIKKNTKDFVREEITEDELSKAAVESMEAIGNGEDEEDSMYEDAKRVVVEAKKASASLLQRRLKVGYARAARLLDILENRGVIGPGEGAKPREVYGVPQGEGAGVSDWFSP